MSGKLGGVDIVVACCALSGAALLSLSPSQDDDHNNAADGRCRCHFRHAERERTDHVLWRLLGETARRQACLRHAHTPSEAAVHASEMGDAWEFFKGGVWLAHDTCGQPCRQCEVRRGSMNQNHLDRTHEQNIEACRADAKNRWVHARRRHFRTCSHGRFMRSSAPSACSHAATHAACATCCHTAWVECLSRVWCGARIVSTAQCRRRLRATALPTWPSCT
jgi:hypothetical protein